MSRKRAPFVAVRTDVRKEERVAVLGDVGGYNEYEALGRIVTLWAWCADRKLEDAPEDSDGYAVPEAVVRRFLGPRGVEAILGGGCDQFALGERRPDGLIYLRGTSETVANLRTNARTAHAGGVKRASTAGERQNGRFVSETTIDQLTAGALAGESPAAHQPTTSGSPAGTSVDPRSTILDPDPEITHTRVCASVPVVPAPPAPETDQLAAQREREARRTVQLEIRGAVEHARREVASELGIADLGLLAQDPGERDLAMHLASAGPSGLETARAQALHAVEIKRLEAVRDRSLKGMTLAIFTGKQFGELVSMDPADVAARRRGPRSAPAIRATAAQIASARVVLERLAADSGVAWSVEDGHAAPVLVRLAEGHTELELRAVATYCGDEWRDNERMARQLNPGVIFGPNFSTYLAQARARYGTQINSAQTNQPTAEVSR